MITDGEDVTGTEVYGTSRNGAPIGAAAGVNRGG